MDAFGYMVGGLSQQSRRAAGTSARTKKAPEPEAAENPGVAATFQEKTQGCRRRKTKATQIGRGYEYMDLVPEPDASPERLPAASQRRAGPLGFTGTESKVTDTQPTGLATLDDNRFDGPATTPMVPHTWGRAAG